MNNVDRDEKNVKRSQINQAIRQAIQIAFTVIISILPLTPSFSIIFLLLLCPFRH